MRLPVTRGRVYFADMSSKSANYCFATRDNPTAVLLLCDVALGEPHELIASQYEAAEYARRYLTPPS